MFVYHGKRCAVAVTTDTWTMQCGYADWQIIRSLAISCMIEISLVFNRM